MSQLAAACDGFECAQLDRHKLIERLGTSEQGLDHATASERLVRYGPNRIREVKGRPLVIRFLENLYHLFAIMLWVGGALAFIADVPELGWTIIAVIFINAAFSFWQEYRAEKATEALKQMIPRNAKVLREGRTQLVPASELVPGDIMVLEEGDAISADGRLIQERELRTDNATLTGESEPVRKTASPHHDPDLTQIEIPNLVFAGTSVAYGTGRAIVFATGMDTQFGKIAELTQSVQAELSPLQKEMGKVVQLVAALAVGLGISFFLLGHFVAGLTVMEGFLFAIGIIVANVPEGLLPTVSLSLAMGVQRMADRHALIKKLSSVETLGSTTVICTDKTGTLTKNEMTVTEMWAQGRRVEVSGGGYEPAGELSIGGHTPTAPQMTAIQMLLRAAALCNNARLLEPEGDDGGTWSVLGDPTEAALLVAACKGGLDLDNEVVRFPRVFELPFDSVRKRMTTVHTAEEGGRAGLTARRTAFVKGAPSEIIGLCTGYFGPQGVEVFSQQQRAVVEAENDALARDGLRVLAIAYRDLGDDEIDFRPEVTEQDLVFLGLMAMMDPPREEVSAAVEQCRTAGIRVVMITGDYGLTAESIAKRIGIVRTHNARIITGRDLEVLTSSQLVEELAEDDVLFARVSPEHKMRIAQALKSAGHVVAMTGDGVNDAPALKAADIGIAMGVAGTDVAKEAADMILTDDNFASIVHAIEEGRAVYDNIRRFVSYIFTSNIPELVPFLLMVIFRIPLALTVMQILAVDLGTDMVPALALGTERPEPGIMQRPPRPRNERLLNRRILARSYLFLGSIQAAVCMSAFYFLYWSRGWRPGADLFEFGERVSGSSTVYILATTMVLGAVVATQIGNAFAQRTTRESVFTVGFVSNRFLLWGIASEIAVFSALAYVPVLQRVFHTGPIGAGDWVYLAALAPTLLVADEIRKLIIRRWDRKGVKPGNDRSVPIPRPSRVIREGETA